MGNGGSVGAQNKCAPGVVPVTENNMVWWFFNDKNYYDYYNACRDKYDGGNYEDLNNQYNHLYGNLNDQYFLLL